MFGFPGMGRQYVTAIQQRDYSMIMGTTLLFAILVAVPETVNPSGVETGNGLLLLTVINSSFSSKKALIL